MRKFMLGIALLGATALAACSTAQIEQVSTTVEGDIQAGTAALCGVVPTLASIADVVLAVTGQAAIATLSNAAVQAIDADICKAAPSPASGKYKALPLRSSAPATIGTTPHGVVVQGWRA